MLPISLFYIELYCYGSHDCKLWWPSRDGDHKGGLLVISTPSVILPGIAGWVNTHRHTNMFNREAQPDFPICTSAFDQTAIQPHLLAVITVHTVTNFPENVTPKIVCTQKIISIEVALLYKLHYTMAMRNAHSWLANRCALYIRTYIACPYEDCVHQVFVTFPIIHHFRKWNENFWDVG